MKVSEMQQEVLRLKKEQDVCILAHSYVAREISEIADFVGDSYQLSVKASQVENQTVLMCGVRFMAETVKILSPEKKVLLSNPLAGCPMAEQMDKDMILQMKKLYPDYIIMAYVNTTAELKTIADVCVTSSSAVKIAKAVENDKILFIPDCNLGAYVAKQVPEKTVKLLQGGCPIHASVKPSAVQNMKALHPEALVLVHPECVPEVVEQADFVGSTSAIMDYAKNSDAKEFIIGTEISIAEHLQYDCPDKLFYPLTKELICPNMKATTLVDVYRNLTGQFGEEIILDKQTIQDARRCIDKMIALGG
ncbi:MAG: quinolinate synthase NadA [Oscillospiraceae bacterium]|nr:quinolinate synthase NadA [Oscillospiraceae bacterium]